MGAKPGPKPGRKKVDPWAVTLELKADPDTARALEVARKRCAAMLTRWAALQFAGPPNGLPNMDVLQLLASCYLQGLRDAAVTLAHSNLGLSKPEIDA